MPARGGERPPILRFIPGLVPEDPSLGGTVAEADRVTRPAAGTCSGRSMDPPDKPGDDEQTGIMEV